MPRNVEIKARLADYEATERLARALAESSPEIIAQEDVFFPSANGRLKLRFLSADRGELIFYRRPDQDGPKTSRYRITRTDDPTGLRDTLDDALGTRAVVRKTRTLYLAGRTRIHLDRVEQLGDFLELEVVLADGESVEAGETEARELMTRLGIGASDLVTVAYVDLLERKTRS